MIKCPKCNDTIIAIERRPDGYCACLNCKHRWKNGVAEKPKPPKQIYIKTDMTEMPKSCKECDIKLFDIENEWSIRDAHCFYRETRQERGRPLWCPLITEKEIKESER